MRETQDVVIDLVADADLTVDELTTEVALASVSTISSFDCFSCPISTASTNGTASSAG